VELHLAESSYTAAKLLVLNGKQTFLIQQLFPVGNVADPDPGSGAFFTPGSGIGFFRILDPGSRIPDPKPMVFLRAWLKFLGKKFFENWPTFFFFSISKIK
jgi:hypothetical protein